jgi:hypothetical protein
MIIVVVELLILQKAQRNRDFVIPMPRTSILINFVRDLWPLRRILIFHEGEWREEFISEKLQRCVSRDPFLSFPMIRFFLIVGGYLSSL